MARMFSEFVMSYYPLRAIVLQISQLKGCL